MIRHSEAIEAWNAIWNGVQGFPIKDTVRAIDRPGVVSTNLSQIKKYFDHLKYDTDKKEIAKSRLEIGKLWHELYPHIPRYRRAHMSDFQELLQYFTQQTYYTPIDIEKLTPVWKAYE